MADKEKTIHKICNSSDDYLEQILAWLKKESEENDGAGFYCNRGIIRKAHEDSELIVMIISGEVVAFSVVDLKSWDILEVRPEHRRQGYGRKLAQHCINQFRKNGVCVLKIECVQNSTLFWEKMGFTMSKLNQDHAYLVFERDFKLPDDCPAANVSISIYPRDKIYDQNVRPVVDCSPSAVLDNSDKVSLSERIICFDPFNSLSIDAVIEIQVNGDTIYSDKIKYDEAVKLGVQRDARGTYFLDYINLS